MQTMKDRLSQRIFEIPNEAREVFCTIELPKLAVIALTGAVTSIYDKLSVEDSQHPLTLFINDRIEDLRVQSEHTFNDKTVISTDVDTMSFFMFACEESYRECKDSKSELDQASIIITATLASILIECQGQESL